LAALLQRPLAQHVQVALEVQHLLAATVATLVVGNPPPAVPKRRLTVSIRRTPTTPD
jgi:hypothetical protein